MSETRIRRVDDLGGFAIIQNKILNDERLGAEHLGFICYLIGRPPGWHVMPNHLGKRFGSGRDKTYRVLNELVGFGYIEKTRYRDPVTKTFGEVEYIIKSIIYDPTPENTEMDKPVTGSQRLEASDRKPVTGNPQGINKEESIRKESAQRNLSCVDLASKFEALWKIKPDRAGANPKKPAREKFLKLCKAGKNPDDIIAAAARVTDYYRGRNLLGTEKVPMLITWLNQHRFDDDNGGQLPLGGPTPNNSGGPTTMDIITGKGSLFS